MFDSIKYIMRLIIDKMEKSNLSNPETMDDIIDRFRSYDIKIGNNCYIYSNLYNGRDSFLLEIGDNVTISNNVQFLMHDNAVVKYTKGKYTDYLGKIKIGDNCFIGACSIILPGVEIANNCIIGAGSVVTKSITKENSVYAGNPAHYICSNKEYIKRNKDYLVNLDNKTKEDIKQMILENPNLLKIR